MNFAVQPNFTEDFFVGLKFSKAKDRELDIEILKVIISQEIINESKYLFEDLFVDEKDIKQAVSNFIEINKIDDLIKNEDVYLTIKVPKIKCEITLSDEKCVGMYQIINK